MDKYLALKDCLYKYNRSIDSIFMKYSKSTKKLLTTELFLSVISKPSYNLTELNISASTISKLLKELFPSRTSTNKPCTFLLQQYNLKWCSNCNEVKEYKFFRTNSIRPDGLNTFCKICQNTTTASTQAFRQKKYTSAKLNRTPSWANLDTIKRIYECAEGNHVDHIIPLQGDLVCGLHVENNLQYLSPHDNVVKNNKFKTDWE